MTQLRPTTPEDASAMARTHIDTWRAAYRGIVPDSFLASLDLERRTEQFRDFLEGSEANTFMVERPTELSSGT